MIRAVLLLYMLLYKGEKRKWNDNILVFSCFQFSCVLIYKSKNEVPNIQLLSNKRNTDSADYAFHECFWYMTKRFTASKNHWLTHRHWLRTPTL